jgi:hypothetical protein
MTTDTALTVIWRRDARGAVESLEIHQGDTLLLDSAAGDNPDDTLDSLLRLARDYYRCDTGDDTLPPDHAIIAMYEEHLA